MVEPNKELQKKVTKKKHDDAADGTDGGGNDDEEAKDKDAKPADDDAVTEVSGWGVYCYDFLLLPITSYYVLLLVASPARF